MSTETSRLKLVKPQRGLIGSDDQVSVISHVNANMQKIDNSINCGLVSSAELPAAPFDGQMVVEENIDTVRVSLSDIWEFAGSDNSQKGDTGFVFSDVSGDSFTFGTGENGPDQTITFTPDPSRRYWIEWDFYLKITSGVRGTRVKGRLRWAAGATVGITDNLLIDNFCNIHQPPDRDMHFYFLWEVAPGVWPDSQITLGTFAEKQDDDVNIVQWAGGGAGTNDERERLLLIRDVGV